MLGPASDSSRRSLRQPLFRSCTVNISYVLDPRRAPALGTERDAGLRTVLDEDTVECSIVKVFGTERLDLVADESLQIRGGYGFLGTRSDRASRSRFAQQPDLRGEERDQPADFLVQRDLKDLATRQQPPETVTNTGDAFAVGSKARIAERIVAGDLRFLIE